MKRRAERRETTWTRAEADREAADPELVGFDVDVGHVDRLKLVDGPRTGKEGIKEKTRLNLLLFLLDVLFFSLVVFCSAAGKM